MAEHAHSGPVELGAPMDYVEHRRTFASFVSLTKITTLATIAILQALALFGLANNGFWLGVLLIVLMMIASAIGLASKGSVSALVGVVVLGFLFMALTLG
jgi:hypothetical protein